MDQAKASRPYSLRYARFRRVRRKSAVLSWPNCLAQPAAVASLTGWSPWSWIYSWMYRTASPRSMMCFPTIYCSKKYQLAPEQATLLLSQTPAHIFGATCSFGRLKNLYFWTRGGQLLHPRSGLVWRMATSLAKVATQIHAAVELQVP